MRKSRFNDERFGLPPEEKGQAGDSPMQTPAPGTITFSDGSSLEYQSDGGMLLKESPNPLPIEFEAQDAPYNKPAPAPKRKVD